MSGRNQHRMYPESMSEGTRAVIGLLRQGFIDPDKIARLVYGSKEGEAMARSIEKVWEVMESRDPKIRKYIQHGLPFGAAGRIRRPIRCRTCRKLIILVPCLLCDTEHVPDEAVRIKGRDTKPLDPVEPTNAKPGSPEKIRVMRQRVSLGMYPCHPGDRMVYPRSPPARVQLVASRDSLGM